MSAKRKKATKKTGRKKPARAAKSSRPKPKKPSREPSKKSVRPGKIAKKPEATPRAIDINQIARAIANEIKTKNAPPGVPLPVDLLRQLYTPASVDEIIAALHQLVGQKIVAIQPDGSFVVASASPTPS